MIGVHAGFSMERVPCRKRRRRSRASRAILLLAVALLLVGIFCLILYGLFQDNEFRSPTTHAGTVYLPYDPTEDWPSLPLPPNAPPAGSPSTKGHAVYPYSVVPGGAHTARELREAILRDPVVGAHYSDFKLSNARIVKLPAAKTAYVSYRLGNNVYWTRKKIKLAKGEELITDGKNYARTRCGNRVAEGPAGATAPDEPPEEILDNPVQPGDQPIGTPTAPSFHVPEVGFLDPWDAPISDLIVPPNVLVGSDGGLLTESSPNHPGPFDPPIFIPPIIEGSPNDPQTPGAPVSPTPEPGTILMAATGAAAILGLRRNRSSKRKA